MSLELLKACPHADLLGAAHLAHLGERLNVNWVTLYGLYHQYGPKVLIVVSKLLSGTPVGALVSEYGTLVYTVIDTLWAGLLPAPATPPVVG